MIMLACFEGAVSTYAFTKPRSSLQKDNLLKTSTKAFWHFDAQVDVLEGGHFS